MPRPPLDREIVMKVDRDTGVLNLGIFVDHPKKGRRQRVGTGTVRMEDLREVAPMLTERLRFEEQLLKAEGCRKKSQERKAASA
jgi:hypothetical protein